MGCPQAWRNRFVRWIDYIFFSILESQSGLSFSNPQFKADEVAYLLKTAKVTYIVVHSSLLGVALKAIQLIGMPSIRVILLDEPPPTRDFAGFHNVQSLILHGRKNMRAFHERQLGIGEGKTKIALLCWSSGTTGQPKVGFNNAFRTLN